VTADHRATRDSIRAKLADLPRVDRNGTPIQTAPAAEAAPSEAVPVAPEKTERRQLLNAPQGPQGDGTPVEAPPSFTKRNDAIALAAALQIPYTEALRLV
jgi:hypothetical protein